MARQVCIAEGGIVTMLSGARFVGDDEGIAKDDSEGNDEGAALAVDMQRQDIVLIKPGGVECTRKGVIASLELLHVPSV